MYTHNSHIQRRVRGMDPFYCCCVDVLFFLGFSDGSEGCVCVKWVDVCECGACNYVVRSVKVLFFLCCAVEMRLLGFF